MKLQAVTICVYYSDFLECVIENRNHFDRWVVMTVRDDLATKRFCERHGIECHVSSKLRPNGSDFSAARNKACVINEGLDALDQCGWVAVLDADVLLPRHLRRRLEAMPLEAGVVYGMGGRLLCHRRQRFELLRDREPWEGDQFWNTQPLGYFHLFDLGASPKRYPELPIDRTGLHDDDCFVELFEPSKRQRLPMSTLHTGRTGVNWVCRTAAEYGREIVSQHRALPNEIAKALGAQGDNLETAAILNYFPGRGATCIVQATKKCYVVDGHGIQQKSAEKFLEADRSALRACLTEEFQHCRNVVCYVPNSVSGLQKIPDGSLDILYITGGVPDFTQTLLNSAYVWMRKLKEGALVCGDTFLHSEWHKEAATITAVFGEPDRVEKCGFWLKRWTTVNARDFRRKPCGADEVAVLIVHSCREDIEPLLLTVHSLRERWSGQIAVYFRGHVPDSVLLLCFRYGCEFNRLGISAEDRSNENDDIEWIAHVQPYKFALLTESGTLFGPQFRLHLPNNGSTTTTSTPCFLAGADRMRYIVTSTHATQATKADLDKLVICEGNPESWTNTTWELWTETKISILETVAVDVRVRDNATIFLVADEEGFGDLQQQWAAMRWPASTTIVLVALGMKFEDVWLPGGRQPDVIRHLDEERTNLEALCKVILDECHTESIIFLPPTISPLACAELFLSTGWDSFDLVIHAALEIMEELSITENLFVSRHFAGLVRRSFILRLLEENLEGIDCGDFAKVMNAAGLRTPEVLGYVDLSDVGWRVLPEFEYLSRRFLTQFNCASAELGGGVRGIASLFIASGTSQ